MRVVPCSIYRSLGSWYERDLAKHFHSASGHQGSLDRRRATSRAQSIRRPSPHRNLVALPPQFLLACGQAAAVSTALSP